MQITYIGDPSGREDRGEIEAFGVLFVRGKPTNVDNEVVARKLAGNPHFKASAEPPKPKRERRKEPVKDGDI